MATVIPQPITDAVQAFADKSQAAYDANMDLSTATNALKVAQDAVTAKQATFNQAVADQETARQAVVQALSTNFPPPADPTKPD